MKVTKLEDVEGIVYKSEKVSEKEIQNEFEYLMAEKLTKMLLLKGLITEVEYDKIMARNRDVFIPFLAEIMI